jgi:YihY family inner membrane protein
MLRRIDAGQQGMKVPAIFFGVMKKYGDDNAGTLEANLAFSGFLCVFPLLLVFVTVLDIVLAGHTAARNSLLHSALGQFPVIGAQLGSNIHDVQRTSVIGLVLGLLGLLWGSTGFAQAGLFSMAQIWNLPGPERPNYVTRLGRSVTFLVVLGVGLIISTALASFGTFGRHNFGLGLVSEGVAVAVNIGMYFLAFRVLTPKVVASRSLVPGACVGGIAWTALLAAGGYLIGHDLRHDSVAYGVFGVVLGLIAWIALGTKLTIYAAEFNTVLAKHLWPRGMVQPPLTDADQRSMALQATQNQRRPEQEVSVGFTVKPMSQGEWLAEQADQLPGDDESESSPSGAR